MAASPFPLPVAALPVVFDRVRLWRINAAEQIAENSTQKVSEKIRRIAETDTPGTEETFAAFEAVGFQLRQPPSTPNLSNTAINHSFLFFFVSNFFSRFCHEEVASRFTCESNHSKLIDLFPFA